MKNTEIVKREDFKDLTGHGKLQCERNPALFLTEDGNGYYDVSETAQRTYSFEEEADNEEPS